MSTNTPKPSRLMTPTKAYSAKQLSMSRTQSASLTCRTPLQPASNRTPFASRPPIAARTPMSSSQTPSTKPLLTRNQKQSYHTPKTVGNIAPRFTNRAPLTVGRAPINTSTINRRLFKGTTTTPNSKQNNPIASKARTADVARLISVRRSINTLQSPLNSCTTPPEVKTPSSKLFRKIFASGNSGTKIPLRTGHFKEFAKECGETTPINKNLNALKKKQRRSSRMSTDFKGLDDEACLLITPSLMRKLICSGGRADELNNSEESVKIHSVKPSSILKYLFKEKNVEKENKSTVATPKVVKKVEEKEMKLSSGLFKAQELSSEAKNNASMSTRVFGNADNVNKERACSIFSTMTLTASPVSATEVKQTDNAKGTNLPKIVITEAEMKSDDVKNEKGKFSYIISNHFRLRFIRN